MAAERVLSGAARHAAFAACQAGVVAHVAAHALGAAAYVIKAVRMTATESEAVIAGRRHVGVVARASFVPRAAQTRVVSRTTGSTSQGIRYEL
jgi:hypothetical protein